METYTYSWVLIYGNRYFEHVVVWRRNNNSKNEFNRKENKTFQPSWLFIFARHSFHLKWIFRFFHIEQSIVSVSFLYFDTFEMKKKLEIARTSCKEVSFAFEWSLSIHRKQIITPMAISLHFFANYIHWTYN